MTIRPLTVDRVEEVLTDAVHRELTTRLLAAQPGHCLRVNSLPLTVMRRLCTAMYATDGYDVVLLLGPRQIPNERWEVTATRLVELRNLEERPLLAFVPPALRTAAEDSFDKSTFQDIPLTDLSQRLWKQLALRLPEDLQRSTRVAIDFIRQYRPISDAELLRYYLSITDNDCTQESAGAAIYHLHCIPDFALYSQPERIRQRLDRNLNAVGHLTDGAGSLLGRVHSLNLKADTIQLSLYHHLNQYTAMDVSVWGEPLACTPDLRMLAFDYWQFVGEDPDRSMLLTVDELSELATRDQGAAPGADNPRYLDLNKAKTVKVKWITDPKPSVAPGLAFFRIEIISTEDAGSGAVAWESKNIAVGTGGKPERARSIKVSEFAQQLEDGLYYFRVRAYSSTGDILNQEDVSDRRALRDPDNPDGKRTNESEDVWFWKSEDEPPPVEPTRNQAVASFAEARTLAYLATIERSGDPFAAAPELQLDKSGWAEGKRTSRTEDIYNIVFDAQTRFTLSVSARLRQIERDTLAQAANLGRWRWVVSDLPGVTQPAPALRPYDRHERVPAAFLAARTAVFTSIRGSDKDDRIVVAADLLNSEQQIIDYAQSYLAWLQEAAEEFDFQMTSATSLHKRSDPLVLDIDVVELRLDEDDQYHSVYLLAPTHPLRLLWLLQRARLSDLWLRQAVASGAVRELLTESVRSLMRRELRPHNLPPSLRSSRDDHSDQITRFYVEHSTLAGDWSLYLREDSKDTQMLRARVDRLLGQSRGSGGAEAYATQALARTLRHYLVQHPYVRTLKINVFNPGDAQMLVDAILELERGLLVQFGPAGGLRYVVNLFGESERLEAIGGALLAFQNPEYQVSVEADAFTQAGSNPLFPKLVFSRNHLDQFLPRQDEFQAHIAIVQDMFPQKVELEATFDGRSSFLHGLIQEPTSFYTSNQDTSTWQHQLVARACPPLAAGDPIPELVAQLLNKMGKLQASNAVGQLIDRLPTVVLRLDVSGRGLLHAIHSQSDWVLTVDRNLGLEYYDTSVQEDRSFYLLDVRPEYGRPTGPRTMVTTRAIDEIRRLIAPRLEQYGLALEEGVEVEFLHVLRSLSGRIALKLLSSPTQVTEAMGLALARLLLEQYDLLRNTIVIPLDAHSGLFSKAAANSLESDASLQRSDLLLVNADDEERTLYLHIVEVKFYTDLSSFSAYGAVQGKVEQQITNTIDVLRSHFDMHQQTPDRLDRHLKTRELIDLLTFYLARSQRYGLVDVDVAATMRRFIEHLDEGYDLHFTGSGLVFDLAGEGIGTTEAHSDLVFHRIGRNVIERLLTNALRRRVLRNATTVSRTALIEEPESVVRVVEEQLATTTFQADESYNRVRAYFQSGAGDDIPPMSGKEPEPGGAREQPQLATEDAITEPPLTLPAVQPLPADDSQADNSQADNSQAHDNRVDHKQGDDKQVDDKQGDDKQGDDKQLEPEVSITPALPPPAYDVLIGNDTPDAKQYGILGTSNGRRIALDLNATNTISLFGVQGGGKSYTLGTIVEMAAQPLRGLNLLPRPLASVIFHYHESQDYPPEFVSMIEPNSSANEAAILRQEFGADVARLDDVLLLTSADKLAARRAEFPSLCVEPIYFSSSELSIKDWRFLMGVTGNQMYMKQANLIMRQLRDQITLPKLRTEIFESELNDSQKKILGLRLDIAEQFINDAYHLADQLRPGRLIIVDLRDEYIDKDEALGLFVVMLNIFANAGRATRLDGEQAGFNKLIVFDEAHKYMDNPDLTGHIVEVIRQMRHQGVSVLIASQDPPSLPNAIIELSSLLVLHRFNSPQWLKHIQKSVTALSELTSAQLSSLRAGEAFVWATKSTERSFTQKAIKMRMRPRATLHGGATQTAV